jgi:hypothetical protein
MPVIRRVKVITIIVLSWPDNLIFIERYQAIERVAHEGEFEVTKGTPRQAWMTQSARIMVNVHVVGIFFITAVDGWHESYFDRCAGHLWYGDINKFTVIKYEIVYGYVVAVKQKISATFCNGGECA